MIQSLRNAINDGKTTGSPVAIELKYSLQDLSSIVVDHPTLVNVKIIPGTYITEEQFKLEVFNAFTQWQVLFNSLYQDYVQLTFVSSKSTSDISINFNASLVPLFSVTNTSIQLNLGINWSIINQVGGLSLLNYLVQSIGKTLSVAETLVLSPMNPSNLGLNYINLFGLTVLEDGILSAGYLNNYSSISNNIVNIYGSSNSAIPYILGCTNPLASNYDSLATVDNNTCIIPDTETLSYNRDNVIYNADGDQYYLANNQTVYAIIADTFGDSNASTIQDTSGSNTSLPLTISDTVPFTSLVITDKEASIYGDSIGTIRYYIVASQAGDIQIFNKDGLLLSASTDTAQSFTFANESISPLQYLSHFNFNYKYLGEGKHDVKWFSKNGDFNRIVLNDSIAQQNAAGEVIAACDLDTYTYGNAESVNYRSVKPLSDSLGAHISVTESGKISTSNETSLPILYSNVIKNNSNFNSFDGEFLVDVLNFDNNKFSEASTINLKSFIVPTFTGDFAVYVDLRANFLQIARADLSITESDNIYSVWVGDSKINNLDDGEFDFSNVDYNFDGDGSSLSEVRNTAADLHPAFSENNNTIVLRPFSLGFSFDSDGLDALSNKEWEAGEFKNGESEVDEAAYGQIVVSIGNKLCKNSFFSDTTTLSYRAWACPSGSSFATNYQIFNESFSNSVDLINNTFNDFNHIGDFHLAIGVSHGFILTKINNTNFSLVSPTTEGGLEIHVPGGKPDMENFNGGWRPVSMQFSPNDNFLYTIMANPDDDTDRKIVIYNIYAGNAQFGCTDAQLSTSISDTAVVVETSDIVYEKITLQDDGSIYIWSESQDYIKITDPDLLASVNLFEFYPTNYMYTRSGLEYFPSSSYGTTTEYVSGVSIFDTLENGLDFGPTDPRTIYSNVYNSSSVGPGIGEGITAINNYDFNSKVIGSGFTYDVVSDFLTSNTETNTESIIAVATQTSNGGELNTVLYLTADSSNNVSIKEYDGTTLTTDDAFTNLDSKDSIFIFPLRNLNDVYMCGYVGKRNAANGSTHIIFRNISVTPDITSSYNYSEGPLSYSSFSLSDDTTQVIPGNKLIERTSEGVVLATTSYEKTQGTNEEIPTVDSNNRISIKLKFYVKNYNVDNWQNDAVGTIVHQLGENKLTDNEDNTFSLSAGSFVHTNISVSQDSSLIAIASMIKGEENITECVISVYNYTENPAVGQSPIHGGRVGNTLKFTSEDFLIDEDLNKMYDTVVRGLEFSQDSSKLYVLFGKHQTANDSSNFYTSDNINILTKTNRVLRLAVDTEENTFKLDGPLNEPTQFSQPSRLAGSFMTYDADGLSTQGNSTHRNNTAMTGLFLNSSGNIYISNIQNSDDYVYSLGVITQPDDSVSSRLNRTAAIKLYNPDEEERIVDGSIGFPLNINQVHRVADPSFEAIDPGTPNAEAVEVYGCTDGTAANFDELATINDGSCSYLEIQNEDCEGNCEPIIFDPAQVPLVNSTMQALINANSSGVGSERELVIDPLPDQLISLYTCDKNTICGCQAVYYFTVSYTIDTLDGSVTNNPWVMPDSSTSIITVSANFVYIPIVDSLGNLLANYPGESTNEYSNFVGVDPANFFLEEDYVEDYCLTCTDSSAPNFTSDGEVTPADCETYTPFCIPDNGIEADACGKYGCTDSVACNYDEEATHDNGNCTYEPTGINDYGYSIDDICNCNGFTPGYNSADYCGDCDTAEGRANLRLKSDTPGCDCDSNPLEFTGGGYYGDCSGLQPTVTNIASNCYYNISGVLTPEDGTYLNNSCDCEGTLPTGSNCDCFDNLSDDQTQCDCDTAVSVYYPDPDNNGYASCDLPAITVCQKTATSATFHDMESASDGDWVDIITGNVYTQSEINSDYIVGPVNAGQCEQCATEGPNGEEQQYNSCITELVSDAPNCLYLYNSETEQAYVNPNYNDYYFNDDCQECMAEGNDQCCNKDAAGNSINDACGQCINLVAPNGVTVTDNQDGTFTAVHNNAAANTSTGPCNYCQTSGGPVSSSYTPNAEQFISDMANWEHDDCQQCGGDNVRLQTDADRFQGYIYSETNNSGYKCNCSIENYYPLTFLESSLINGTLNCCEGYYWDACAFNGQGGCIDTDVDSISKDCNNECYQQDTDGNYTVAIHSYSPICQECNEGGADSLNAAGCCDGREEGCQASADLDGCFESGTAPEFDECAVCGGDNSTCTGCTDPEAFNYVEGNTIDDGSCNTSSLYGAINSVQFTPGGQVAVVEEAYYLDINLASANIQEINNNPVSVLDQDLTELQGTNIYIDQPSYTQKCQVISYSNRVLYLTNPLQNAEVYYTGLPSIGNSIVQNESYQSIDYENGASLSYTAAYYFRVKENIELTQSDIEILFASVSSQIESISIASGLSYIPTSNQSNLGNIVQEDSGTTIPDSDSPSVTAEVYTVYKIIPKIGNNGKPFAFTFDFSNFMNIPIPGCMDPEATNYNPSATYTDGSCNYEVIPDEFNLTIKGNADDVSKLKWVLYNDNNQIVNSNFGDYPATFSSTNEYSLDLNTSSSCMYFVPIGFTSNDNWQQVSFTISLNSEKIFSAVNGIETIGATRTDIRLSTNNRGAALIKLGNANCSLGCNSLHVPNEISTDYCKAIARKDVKEFTDIYFKLEVNALPQDEDSFLVEVYDLNTGDLLLEIESEELAVQDPKIRQFAIDKETRIGVRIKNEESLILKYEITSEYGETIIKKTLN